VKASEDMSGRESSERKTSGSRHGFRSNGEMNGRRGSVRDRRTYTSNVRRTPPTSCCWASALWSVPRRRSPVKSSQFAFRQCSRFRAGTQANYRRQERAMEISQSDADSDTGTEDEGERERGDRKKKKTVISSFW